MREILFRGKRLDNGEWAEGNLLFDPDLGSAAISWFGYDVFEHGIERWETSKSVDPKTVGQFTGLLDKNGKKIFEGDLLNGFVYPFLCDNVHNYFAEVVWFDDSPAFGLCTWKHPLSAVKGISHGNCEFVQEFDGSLWEVIGNIHDNPELLKEE